MKKACRPPTEACPHCRGTHPHAEGVTARRSTTRLDCSMRRGPGWAGESGFLRARPTARAARSGTRPRACNLNRPSPFARRPRFPPPEARNRSITNPAPASPSRGPPQRHRRPIPFHCCMRGNRGNNKRETIVIWEQSNHRNALGEKIQAGPKTLACVNFRLVG